MDASRLKRDRRSGIVDGVEYGLVVAPEGKFDVEIELTPGPGEPVDDRRR